MRSLVLSFFCVFLGTSAIAQSIQVRSGQHEDFTRLIVDLPERIELQIDQDSTQALLSFPGQELDFDTTRVFNRIARERIVDVVTGKDTSTLLVKFGCQCEVSSFWHGKSLLVLDVRESSADPSEVGQQVGTVTEAGDFVEKTRLKLPKASNSLAASLANSQFQHEPSTQLTPTQTVDHASPDHDAIDETVISEARDRLIRQIGRAASQGLLAPKSSLKTDQREEKPVNREHVEKESDKPKANPKSHVNLRAQSSIDRDFLATLNGNNNMNLGQTCLEDGMVDVGNWGTEKSFAEQVGQSRLALMGEFDHLNRDAALKLTRLYLHYGFGAEARMTLALMDEETEEIAILQSMAAIMEGNHASANPVLSNQLTCQGPVALWSVLSYESIPRDLQIEVDAILRTFDALPVHLRKHLGPILSRRFFDAGYREAADKALRIINRSGKTSSSESQLVEAEIIRSEGQKTKAAETMKEVVETNSEPSAEALIGMIDTTVQSGKGVSFDHAILAGAYAQQNRGGPLETDLLRTYLIGLSASGAFEQSYEEYLRLSSELPRETNETVRSEMLRQLTQRADDITFLKYVFDRHMENPLEYSPRVANETAVRLLKMGFAPQARRFLEREIPGKLGRERKLIRAQIALAENLPRQAEVDLLNIESVAANLLRAQARSQIGDHNAAATLYSSGGEKDEALRQAWFAEDWKRLKKTQDTAIADMAALVDLGLSEEGTEETSRPKLENKRVLAQNLELIQQSLAARDTIEALLQENPSP